MKKLLLLFSWLYRACCRQGHAQDNDYIKRPALGVNFFFNDFNGGVI